MLPKIIEFKVKNIKTALISVYNKEGLIPILEEMKKIGIKIYSTGGTYEFITNHGYDCHQVEELTGYPSILGGRVKTLHPKVFGGILARPDLPEDVQDMEKYGLPFFDFVIVDLYPFSQTVAGGAPEEEVIEKIDIGGVSLIRAAAKNFKHVLVIPSRDQYSFLLDILTNREGNTDLLERKLMASIAFRVTQDYDHEIFEYFSNGGKEDLTYRFQKKNTLRYGENPHQQGFYFGDLDKAFIQLHGKQISYNNILDIDTALRAINDFEENTFLIIKHNNPCGIATRDNLLDAWRDALACDPVSAFGGIIATHSIIHEDIAQEIDKIFFEIIIAPGFSHKALEILKRRKNRIILQMNDENLPLEEIRTALFGTLVQERDIRTETANDLKTVTHRTPTPRETEDLLFAMKCVKHLKSNAIAIVKNKQMIGAGMGQPNRVDALKQAVEKARRFGFDTREAVLASDAFFPFSDSVELAHEAGITAVIQPGGSIRDQDSIDFCNQHNVAMIFTGIRHFKH